MQVTISGINEGKPFEVEKINIDGLEYIQNMPKDRQSGAKAIGVAALISCNCLEVKPGDQKYIPTLESWIGRASAEDVLDLMEKFLEVNKSFFDKGAKLRKAAPQTSE